MAIAHAAAVRKISSILSTPPTETPPLALPSPETNEAARTFITVVIATSDFSLRPSISGLRLRRARTHARTHARAHARTHALTAAVAVRQTT